MTVYPESVSVTVTLEMLSSFVTIGFSEFEETMFTERSSTFAANSSSLTS